MVKISRKIIFIFLLVTFFAASMVFTWNFCLNKEDNDNAVNEEISQSPEIQWGQDNIALFFENKRLNLSHHIYYDTNRYYLPVSEIVTELGGKIILENSAVTIILGNKKQFIDLTNNTYTLNNQIFNLKKKVILIDNAVYISLFDFTKLFNLKVTWNIEAKSLSFYYNRDKTVTRQCPATGKPALIRLEDLCSSPFYLSSVSLEKLRIISDYLYSENVPFHVTWIPRYIDPRPSSYADIDISKQYSMANADFLYTLDYLIDRNGVIGLHGYTHQYGYTVSGNGYEFDREKNTVNIPSSKEYAQERIDAAKVTAQRLDVPYTFFTVPHYSLTTKQLLVVQANFNYIYEAYPRHLKRYLYRVKVVKDGDRNIIYVPAPINFLNISNDERDVVNVVKNLNPNVLASFFYHPYLEFDNITLQRGKDGYPSYTYASDSTLHQLVNTLEDKGYRFVKITELK
ncbi:MAG: DUF2334 domain-containing protein [Eubacteriaceae bacterium]|nr:DUF2334 domain-containing protein [Eubacteriaceae bacterium]